jgi:hypothetical protein
MRIFLLSLFTLGLSLSLSAQRSYKEMMHDMSVNFYDVVRAAEAHFEAHGTGKGSGYKGFQRWKNENESKYYPSGDRSQVDPFFAENAYRAFLENNPQSAERRRFSRWEDLGPYDANNVTSHYSPGIGRVEAVYVDPANPQKIYLGSRSGGFWRTTDEGQSWRNTTDFLIASGVNTITASPTHSDSVLINLQNAHNEASHGVFRSVNGGLSWQPTNFVPANLGWGGLGTNQRINKIAYHPRVPNLVFVASQQGVYRSTDNLQTWTRLYAGADIRDIEFHPTNNDIIYLYDHTSSNRNTFLISYNQGGSYSPVPDINTSIGGNGFLGVSPVCENCVYLAGDNGVWQFNIQSGNWRFLSNPNESCDGFAVSDRDTLQMVYGYLNVEASGNGGQSFTEVCHWLLNNNGPNGYVHADIRIIECVNGVFYVGTDGYLAKSADGGTNWFLLNDGTGIRENYGVAVSQSNWKVNMCGSQDNGTSVTDESGWIEWNGGDGMHAVIHPLNDDWMIGSWQYGTRQRTQDGAMTREGIETPGGQGDWEAPILLDPNQQMRVFSLKDSIHKTEEFGNGWQYLSRPFAGDIQEAAIAYNNSQIMAVSRNSALQLSTDGGQSFRSISGGLPGHRIKAIAFAPNDDNTLVVTYDLHQNDGEKVFISRDLGNSWTNITANLGSMPLRAVVIDHTPAANIYVGGEIGVYTKPMNATNWALYSLGLPNTTIQDLEIVMGANILRAATWGRGLWEYTLVDRNDFPRILFTSITHTPTEKTPKAGREQKVRARIAYDDSLSSVFVRYSEGAPTFDQSLSMVNVSDSTWETEQDLPGFAEGTQVFFKVYAVGSRQDTSLTHKFMYTVREFSYCGATGLPNTGADFIDFVGMEELAHNSGQDYYGDFTDQYATLYTDSTFTLQIDLNFHWDPDTTGAWIDFDHDGEFEASEFIVMGQLNANHESFGTVRVPANAVIDTVRMRVRSQYYYQGPIPCGDNSGEVEDYSVIIKKGQALSLDSELARRVRLYPNPNAGIFKLEIPAGKRAQLIITDPMGKQLQQRRIREAQSTLDISWASPGVYFLQLEIEGEKVVKKIVKE